MMMDIFSGRMLDETKANMLSSVQGLNKVLLYFFVGIDAEGNVAVGTDFTEQFETMELVFTLSNMKWFSEVVKEKEKAILKALPKNVRDELPRMLAEIKAKRDQQIGNN